MNILYFANLGDENATELLDQVGEREAVLLSTPNAAPRTLAAARAIKAKGIPVAADNANTAVIFQIAKEFVDRAVELYRARTSLPRPGVLGVETGEIPEAEIPPEPIAERGLEAAELFYERTANAPSAEAGMLGTERSTGRSQPVDAADLQKSYRALAQDIARRCGDFVNDERQAHVLATQESVNPIFFTCLEDLTIPIMVQLDIEPQYTGLRRPTFVTLQTRGLNVVADVIRGKLGKVQSIPYATLHAFDYDSAYQVGQKAAKIRGLQGVAIGAASFLNDRNYINSYTLKRRRVWVKGRQNVPQRYLRLLLVTLGMLDGFASVRGKLPRFHALGAGAPIALPLLALCGFGSPLLSIDSTAPEKNASIGKLFVNDPAPLTVSVDKVAQAIVEGRQRWDCPCPYCRGLQETLPFDIGSARRFYKTKIAPREIERADLERDDGIGQYLSLLWETRTQPNKKQIYRARVNHSHWTIAEIARALRKHARSYAELRRWVGAQCEAYQATAAPTFALQIDECLRVIDQLRSTQ